MCQCFRAAHGRAAKSNTQVPDSVLNADTYSEVFLKTSQTHAYTTDAARKYF